MELKKSPKANLDKNKTLSILMGLVVALAVVFVSFEWGTPDVTTDVFSGIVTIPDDDPIDITIPDKPLPPPPPPEKPIADQIDILDDDDDIPPVDIDTSEDNINKAQAQPFMESLPEDKVEEVDTKIIFKRVEEMPEFPGGDTEMLRWVSRMIKYPVIAQQNGIQGRVICSFTINTDGSVVDAEIVRGIDPSLDREALRVVNLMPKWTPGKQRGIPVRVSYTIPVVFRLR